MNNKEIIKKIKRLFLFTVIFFLWSTLVCLLWKQHVLLTFIMILLCVIYILFFKSKDDLIYFAVAAIFGPIGEILGTKSGLWTYNCLTIFGIPYWLPLAWGITAIMVKRLIISAVEIHHEIRRNN
jgi:hypothetical protein